MLKEFLQGRFINHPLHPAFVHIPIGLWIGSFVLDMIYLFTRSQHYATSSYFCMAGGIIGAVLAVPPGLADLIAIPSNTRPHRIALLHMTMNLAISAIFLINFLARRGEANGIPLSVSSGTFVLSLVSVVLLGVSGYLGGLLVYQHGIGHKTQTRDKQEYERPAA